MELDEIKKIDCGSKYIDKFPNQIKKKEQKPTFEELEKKLENYKGIYYLKLNVILII